jgi:23S rRNA (uracil1939-C5)-methyltransferase
MIVPGTALSLSIEKPAAGGRMIARVDGQIVLVSGAIPGERVRARMERRTKGVAYAETIAIDEPSPDRRDAFVDPHCGGSLYAHIAYPRQLTIKADVIADALRRIGRIELASPIVVAASPEDGYRMRARLHVRGHRVGFFREGTHDICDARATRQLLPESCDVVDRLSAALRSLGADAVREIDLLENVDATERVVHFEAAERVDRRIIAKLASVDGVTAGQHVSDTLRIGGSRITLRRHVQAFFQGNRYLLASLVSHVAERVPVGTTVADLYAGAGLFAVAAAASRDATVFAVEGDPFAADDLRANAAPLAGRITAVTGAVEGVAAAMRGWRGARHSPFDMAQGDRALGERSAVGSQAVDGPLAETVIVDPPRTGMSREALEAVLGIHAARVIYVSCDVATLARDSRRIVDAGYAIARADAFDLFPNTPHVETVVVFERR